MKGLLLDFITNRRMEGAIVSALERTDFELHVQPVVDLATRRIVAAEALIRWHHLERGLLSASEFIPFAEDRGLLPSIGTWVIGAARDAAVTLSAIDPAFRLWFNASMTELGDPGWLRRIAKLGSLDGLGVEITERIAMGDPSLTLRTLDALKDAGLAIALDDFGTGYSSLAQLKRLPLDVVKLDRTFIAAYPGDLRDVEIVSAILRIGDRFGFDTVAEGIETSAQAVALRNAGCRFGQGFHLGPPMPIGALADLVRASSSAAS